MSERSACSGSSVHRARRRQRSERGFSTTSASSSERGCRSANEDLPEAPVMKLLRPHSGLRVWTTTDESPTLVTARTMKREACTILYKVCPPMNSRMMEVGGMAAISEGLSALHLLRNSSSEAALG